MAKYLILGVLLLSSLIATAQHGKIINKDFEIDAYNAVEFDLFGEIKFEPWEADYVLVETTVKVWDTPKSLFTRYVGKGRYFCEIKASSATAKISAVPVDRKELVVNESVVSVIYYPKSFNINGSKITRQESVLSSTDEKEEK